MAGKLADNKICKDCDTEIRAAAMFCYHCGAAVVMPEVEPVNKKTGKLNRNTKIEKNVSVKEPKIEETSDGESESLEIETKVGTNGKGKLRSAASIRNKARRIERKKVEIYWEEHENAPNNWFLGVSIVLVLFTIAILFIAMYLK